MPSHRVGFLRRFGLKTGIHSAHFSLESGMVFKGTTGVYERIYCFNSKWVRKKEKHGNSKGVLKNFLACVAGVWKGREGGFWKRGKFFCFCSNLSKDNIISALRPSLKTVVENYIFWSEIRSGFREQGGHTLTKDSKEYPQGEYRRRRCPFEITKLLIEHMGRGTLDLP